MNSLNELIASALPIFEHALTHRTPSAVLRVSGFSYRSSGCVDNDNTVKQLQVFIALTH
jgi:hypothetical protein